MPRTRNTMAIILLIITLAVIAVIFAVWWHVFFGMPNPPLPRATVAVTTSSTQTSVAAPAAPPTASSSASASTASAAPGADQLAIDGATFNVEIASTTVEQTRGLSYRPSLGAQDGMLFVFPSAGVQQFWMKDMHFPLDMIWISGTTVAGFAENVPAPASGTALWALPIYASPAGVDKVLEVNAGAVARYGIKAGDAVVIGPME